MHTRMGLLEPFFMHTRAGLAMQAGLARPDPAWPGLAQAGPADLARHGGGAAGIWPELAPDPVGFLPALPGPPPPGLARSFWLSYDPWPYMV